MKKIIRFIVANRWPAFLGGILLMSITAHAILVFVATRGNAPRPVDRYYERSLEWDADAADVAASRELGWQVAFDIPGGDQYQITTVRPVDIIILDRDGKAVVGLTGRLVGQPPGDTSLLESPLTELPHDPGHYRTLARLAPGIWKLSIDAHLGDTHFVHTESVDVDGGER
jgi:hypothetical protein